MTADLTAIFRKAETAFLQGDNNTAKIILNSLLEKAGGQPALYHLLALSEHRLGNHAISKDVFLRAIALAPREPGLRHDLGHLLTDAGDFTGAMESYATALRLRPGWPDAVRSLASALQKAHRYEEAGALLNELVRRHPHDAAALTARGTHSITTQEFGAAADDYDAALRIEPDRRIALNGRAWAALQLGENDAVHWYRRALQISPQDRALILGLAEALEAAGDTSGIDILTSALETAPDWIEGHCLLARMRKENGDDRNIESSFRLALKVRPNDKALHLAHADILASAQQYDAALAAIRQSQQYIGRDLEIALLEAKYAAEAGKIALATQLFAELSAHPEAREPAARHMLRTGDHDRAAKLLQNVTTEQPDSISAWAMLGIAWRLLGDPRHEWLNLQPNLWDAQDLPIEQSVLDHLASLLRAFHRSRAHPLGQSLRGGTQTRGRLFGRRNPELAAVRDLIEGGIASHVSRLPDHDENHPFLRQRNRRFSIEGSWSVRLTDAGYHVRHIHPEGVLSSAFYIALPEQAQNQDQKAGWLEIGAPPQSLDLPLPPLALVEPRPGRLVLFPSYMYHGTRPFQQGERLTIAFDAVPA